MGGRVWRFSGTLDRPSGIRRPGASADTTTISYKNGLVSSVTNEGVTTSYSRSVASGIATMTATDALSGVTTVVSDLSVGRPTSVTDALSRSTSYQYDSDGRLTRMTAPAPTTGANRPEVRYSYTLTNGEYRVSAVSTCASGTASTCLGTGVENRILQLRETTVGTRWRWPHKTVRDTLAIFLIARRRRSPVTRRRIAPAMPAVQWARSGWTLVCPMTPRAAASPQPSCQQQHSPSGRGEGTRVAKNS
jgi:YD repeat-containing protein